MKKKMLAFLSIGYGYSTAVFSRMNNQRVESAQK